MSLQNIAKTTATAMALMLAMSSQVFAGEIVVGQSVTDSSSTDPVGIVGSFGEVYFFIPLSESEDEVWYGSDGGGLSSDTCSTYSGTCTGGSLHMLMYFGAEGSGSKTVTIHTLDFDAPGVNDPWYFVETLQIYDLDGNLITEILTSDALSDGSNHVIQSFEFDVVSDGAFYIELVFNSGFDEYAPDGYYGNTREGLLAYVTVPEPATFAMFGLGLLLVARANRRRKTK